MRLLLIAYEFPPSPSPQSLRWAYLSRELVSLGHEVQILTIHLGGETPGLPEPPPQMRVTRTFAGPLRGMLAHLRDRRQRRTIQAQAAQIEAAASPMTALRPPRAWKQTLSDNAQAWAARFVFPDVRGEWAPWARPALRRVLREFEPDVVISSHEPATTLELGLLAKAAGFPWIADLGDPVLAPYTPQRWHARATALERETCRLADHVVVTHDGAARLLEERHGRRHDVSVITQGFAAESPSSGSDDAGIYDPRRLELLYTGSFYRFRRPDDLLAAIREQPMARLNIASVTVPESLIEAAIAAPQQIRLLGFLPHQRALELQRAADILVNIANDDPSQVPGKFYEYLGSRRPILHIGSQGDAISEQVARLRRGWTSDGTLPSLRRWFEQATALKASGRLDEALDLDLGEVDQYRWSSLARQLERIAASLIRPARSRI